MATATERVFPASPTTGRTSAALAAPWLFTGEDNLRLVIINSQPGVVVTLDGRRLGPDDLAPQPFVQTFAPSADRQPNTFDVGFGDGFLLNCSLIVSSGSPLVGQTYCMLQVIRGLSGSRLVLGCLLGGYITAMQHLAYPGSPIESSTGGEPFVRAIALTVPAAGGELLQTVPAGARWEVLAVRSLLGTSAVAGTRSAILQFTVAGSIIGQAISQYGTAPAAFADYNFCANVVSAQSANLVRRMDPIPSPLILPAGSTVGTLTLGIDAGDQWSQPAMLAREWLEAA